MGWKTLIAFAIVVSIPLLGLLTISHGTFRDMLKDEVLHDLNADLKSAWLAFHQPLESVRVTLATYAKQPDVVHAMASSDAAALNHLFARASAEYPHIDAWLAVDRNMAVIGSLTGQVGKHPAINTSLNNLVARGGSTIISTEIVNRELFTEYGFGVLQKETTKVLAQVIVAPIAKHGSLIGMVSLNGDGYLSREIYRALPHNDASLAISMDNRIVATEPNGNRDWVIGEYLPEAVRQAVTRGEIFREMVMLDGRELHIAADPVYNSDMRVVGGLILATGPDKINHQLEAYVRPIYIFLGIGMLLSVAIAYLAYRDTLRPLQAIRNAQSDFAGGDHDVRTEIITRDEFEQLGEGFNRMASSVQEQEKRIARYNALSTLAAQEISVDDLLRRAIDQVVEVSRSSVGAIYFADGGGKRLKPVVAHSLKLNTMSIIKIGEGVPGRAALERRAKRLSRDSEEEHVQALAVETGLGMMTLSEVAYLPLVNHGELIGLLLLGTSVPYSDREFQLLVHLAAQVALIIDNTRTRKNLVELAQTDTVTGVFNRQHFTSVLEKSFSTLMRDGAMLSTLVVDIDHFGKIFGQYGFQVADTVLTHVAHILRKTMPEGVMITRYSDQAFAILLPYMDGDQALTLGETIRKEIIGVSIIPFGDQSLTTSIGVATAPHEEVHTGVDLVRRADAAVHAAKQSGRNRVSFL